jgi:aminopeptidase N
LPAALCWAAAWDMCRDGEMAARDYVQLVLSGVSSVADISVVQLLLRLAGMAARTFADPAWRATGLELMARSLRKLAESAPAGSDTQLACMRAFTGVATSAHDLLFLAALLDGSAVLEGLSVDTDLRWSLLGRLVSRGMAGEAEIAAELARDATDAGERSAAACRAAVPSAEAKLAAWESLAGGKLPLATFRAVLGGFTDVDQPELRGPYRERYFSMVGDAWRDWSAAMAQDFVSGMYASFDLSAETVAASDAYIASAEPPAALNRLLSEGRDDVLRALRGQERDRQAPS